MPRHENIESSSEDLYTGLAKRAIEIASLKKELAEAKYRADHDGLTGLLNKEAFKRHAEDKIAAGSPFGLIFIDMVKFKEYNDTQGHEVGDNKLRTVGQFLKNVFRRAGDELTHETIVADRDPGYSTVAGRYGGDEFGVLIDLAGNSNRDSNPANQMENALDHLRNEAKALDIDFSAGGAIWMPNVSSIDVSELLSRADNEMYQDKAKNRLGLR